MLLGSLGMVLVEKTRGNNNQPYAERKKLTGTGGFQSRAFFSLSDRRRYRHLYLLSVKLKRQKRVFLAANRGVIRSRGERDDAVSACQQIRAIFFFLKAENIKYAPMTLVDGCFRHFEL
jgi:hypothetical protein